MGAGPQEYPPPRSITTTTNPPEHWSVHKRAELVPGNGPSLSERVEFAMLGSPLWREALGAAEVASIYNMQAQLIKAIVKHSADPKCHINAK